MIHFKTHMLREDHLDLTGSAHLARSAGLQVFWQSFDRLQPKISQWDICAYVAAGNTKVDAGCGPINMEDMFSHTQSTPTS